MSTLTATPGQTIGPFFGYALPFERDNELVPPGVTGRNPIARDGFRRRRRTGARRAAGDLAGRRRRCDPDRHGIVAPRRVDVHRMGPGQHRRRRPIQLHHRETRCHTSWLSTVLRGHGVRPRPAQSAVHPRLPSRRAAGLRAAACVAPRTAPRHPDRGGRRARPAVRHPPAGRRTRPSFSVSRGTADDRSVLAGGPPRGRPDERRCVPGGDARRRKCLAGRACRCRGGAVGRTGGHRGDGIGRRCRVRSPLPQRPTATR